MNRKEFSEALVAAKKAIAAAGEVVEVLIEEFEKKPERPATNPTLEGAIAALQAKASKFSKGSRNREIVESCVETLREL